MPDNATLPLTGTGDPTLEVATDEISGVHYQRVKPVAGVDGVALDVSATNPMPVVAQPKAATAAAHTSVAAAASSTLLLAANAVRLGAAIFNDSTVALYLKLDTGATTSSFMVKVPADSLYELPFRWTGVVYGIWASATGNARITELT